MSEDSKTVAPTTEKVRLFSKVAHDVEIKLADGQTIQVPPHAIVKDVPAEWLKDVEIPPGVKVK